MSQTRTRKSEVKTLADHIDWHDRTETHKMTVHVSCILVGVAITAGMSFVSAAVAIHFVGVIAGVPSVVQEFIDRVVRGW